MKTSDEEIRASAEYERALRKIASEAAFPVPDMCDEIGMSRREYIATQAMVGMLANSGRSTDSGHLVRSAFAHADIMLDHLALEETKKLKDWS